MDSLISKVEKNIQKNCKTSAKIEISNTISQDTGIKNIFRSYDYILSEDFKINFLVISVLLSLFYFMSFILLTDFIEVLCIIYNYFYRKLFYYFLKKIIKLKRRLRNQRFYVSSNLVDYFMNFLSKFEEIDSHI
jgi:hypothetical protein